MQKSYLMVRDIDQLILGYIWHDDPDEGPVPPQAAPFPDVTLVSWGGVFDRSQHSETSEAHWVDGDVVWTEAAPLDAQRARKAAEMSQCCADAILAGFSCDALGAGYTYPAKPNDQANLTGSVLRSMYSSNGPDWRTPFWCSDADGLWEFRLHTAAEIQSVGDCAVVARLKCMARNEQLQAQIVGATEDELPAIVWSAP